MSHKVFLDPYLNAAGNTVVQVTYGPSFNFSRWIATLSKEEALQLGQELIAAATTNFSQESEEIADT